MSLSKWTPLVLLHSMYDKNVMTKRGSDHLEDKLAVPIAARRTIRAPSFFLAMLLFRNKAEICCVSWWETPPSDLG